MKVVIAVVFGFFSLHSQVSRDALPNGVLSDGRLIDMFENIKNRTKGGSPQIAKVSGSPYFDENFKTAQVDYFGEILKDNIYIRYNAFSDEMEIAKTKFQPSSEDVLIKNNKVACIIDGFTYKYLGYVRENKPPAVGYVKELFKGKIFSLYVRETKQYKEATIAKSSLERSFPPRFSDKIEYYISIENGSLNQIKLSKKRILSALKSYTEQIKSFIDINDVKLKNLDEFIALFQYLDKSI